MLRIAIRFLAGAYAPGHTLLCEERMEKHEFVRAVFAHAQFLGYTCRLNRKGIQQIDFKNKSLHQEHIEQLYPAALWKDSDIKNLIEAVAPGRPCTHKPMREIIQAIRQEDT